jgi:hypothetical protein
MGLRKKLGVGNVKSVPSSQLPFNSENQVRISRI